MEDYNLQEFSAVGGRIVPKISLGQSGGFGISAGFVKKYDLSNVLAVKLFYDKDKNAVGFKFLQTEEVGALKVKMAPNQGGGYINAKEFLSKFEIDRKKSKGSYDPKEVETSFGKVFIIELKDSLK